MQKRNEWLSVLLAALGGILAVAVLSLLVRYAGADPILWAVVLSVLYALGLLIWQLVSRRIARNPELDQLTPALGNIMFDMVQKMDQPVFICDEISERIIWHNNALKSVLGENRDLRRNSVGSLFGKTAGQMMNLTGEMSAPLKIGDRYFGTRGYRFQTPERTFCLCFLTEQTDLEELKQHILDKDLIVGYIMIDNVNEMLQYEQERYRSVSSKIDTILRDWAAEANGILKEYEKDRYLFLVTREKFDSFREQKFDILDVIRDIHFGDDNQPVTISAGFANGVGSFAEKEKNAQQALDMALQRGGDQIVVRGEGETEIYGGRTKSIQKRTRVRSRVVATELVSLISQSSNVLIMGHRFADFDSFASCVGLARIAKFCGVPVHIIINRKDPNIQGCLDMMAEEEEYRSVFIDGAKGLDLLRTDTLTIVSDVNNPALFEAPEVVSAAERLVVIDHHRKTSTFDREPLISYIEPSASAASELVSEMLEQVMPDEGMLASEAKLMLAGILLDTKQFTKNTSSRTFAAALFLRDHGADPSSVIDLFSTDLDELQREARIQSNVVIYRGVTAIAMSEGESDSADRVPAAKAADRLLSVEGVEASFTIIKLEDRVHISARSKGKINVQLILERIGGGGHFDAAATQLSVKDVTEALVILKNAIDTYLDQSQDTI